MAWPSCRSVGAVAQADLHHILARIYVLAGEPEKALGMLEFPLKTSLRLARSVPD